MQEKAENIKGGIEIRTTDNTLANRQKGQKVPTTIYKALHTKLKIE
jgi:hypothetical protein